MTTATTVGPEVADPFTVGEVEGAPTPAELFPEDAKPEAITDPFEAALAGVAPETVTRTRGDVIATVPHAIRKAVEQAYNDYRSSEHTPAGTSVYRTVRFADVKTADQFKALARKYAGARPDGKVTLRATVTEGQPGDGVFVRYTVTPFVAKPRKA